jgi:hypothetical protein
MEVDATQVLKLCTERSFHTLQKENEHSLDFLPLKHHGRPRHPYVRSCSAEYEEQLMLPITNPQAEMMN